MIFHLFQQDWLSCHRRLIKRMYRVLPLLTYWVLFNYLSCFGHLVQWDWAGVKLSINPWCTRPLAVVLLWCESKADEPSDWWIFESRISSKAKPLYKSNYIQLLIIETQQLHIKRWLLKQLITMETCVHVNKQWQKDFQSFSRVKVKMPQKFRNMPLQIKAMH